MAAASSDMAETTAGKTVLNGVDIFRQQRIQQKSWKNDNDVSFLRKTENY